MVNRGYPNPSGAKFAALYFSPLALVVVIALFAGWRNSGYKIGNKTMKEWWS